MLGKAVKENKGEEDGNEKEKGGGGGAGRRAEGRGNGDGGEEEGKEGKIGKEGEEEEEYEEPWWAKKERGGKNTKRKLMKKIKRETAILLKVRGSGDERRAKNIAGENNGEK